MKKVCFVVSHLGSGSGRLVSAMNVHAQCQIHESSVRYDSPAAFRWLFRAGHKCGDASAVYGDHLLFNASISSKSVYGAFRAIFVIRPARGSLNSIVRAGYSPSSAASYYCFRLRRMCEAARRSPGAPLLEWDDLAKERSARIIKEYLGLSSPLAPASTDEEEGRDICPESVIDYCQRAYERYYYYLSRLELRRLRDQDA